MGGIFNKTHHSDKYGPASKLGIETNCQLCNKTFSKDVTFREVNNHQEHCKKIVRENRQEEINNMFRDLREVNSQANNVQSRQKKRPEIHMENKYHKDNNYMSQRQPDSKPYNKGKKNKAGNYTKDMHYKKYYQGRFSKKENKFKDQSAYKPNIKNRKFVSENAYANFGMLNNTVDANYVSLNPYISHAQPKHSNLYNKEFSSFNSNYLKDFPFEEKIDQFKNQIKNLKIDWREGACTIYLERDSMLNLSMKQFEQIDPYKELHINFKGEVSHDAGGLIREWFTIIFKELQNENLGLFERSDTEDFSYKINSNVQPTTENLDIFNFIGKILAKALLDNLTVNACFNKLIYKIILDEPVTLDDLVFIDKPLYRSLKEMKKMERVSELGIYFEVQVEIQGKVHTDELVKNGSEVLVTNENLDDYIKKRIGIMQLKDKMYVNEIKSGIFSLIPGKLISIFTSDEFELLLNGTPFIDLYDWRLNTSYKNYDENSNIILNFWEVLSSFSQEELARYLQFCTGSSKVPIGGFSVLESNRGNTSKFCITRVDYNQNSKNFIRAHTCFNRLDLPQFPDKDELEKAMRYIVENEILGFGID